MRISDWSSDVCSSDLNEIRLFAVALYPERGVCLTSIIRLRRSLTGANIPRHFVWKVRNSAVDGLGEGVDRRIGSRKCGPPTGIRRSVDRKSTRLNSSH